MPLDRFEALEANDVLFHPLLPCSQNRERCPSPYTSVLPVLAEGVYVHIHAVFLALRVPPALDRGRAKRGISCTPFTMFLQSTRTRLSCSILARRPAPRGDPGSSRRCCRVWRGRSGCVVGVARRGRLGPAVYREPPSGRAAGLALDGDPRMELNLLQAGRIRPFPRHA